MDLYLQNLLTSYQTLPGMLCWKSKDGRYLWLNSALTDLLGFETSIIGKTDTELWPEEALLIKQNDELILSSDETHSFEETWSIHHKKTSVIATKSPLKNATGDLIGLVVTVVPIHRIHPHHAYSPIDIKKTEQNSIFSDHYLRNIIDSVPGSIYWKDKDGVWLGANTHTTQATGISAEQLIGKTDFELFPEHAEALRENDLKVMRTGCTLNKEECVILPNGEKRYYAAEKMPLFDLNGNIIGIIGNSIDITELKNTQKKLAIAQLEVEKEQDMRKTVLTLVGDIVHDLRTPLTAINIAANILADIAPELNAVIQEARALGSQTLQSINETQLHYVLHKMPSAQKDSIHMINEFIKVTLRELSVAHNYQNGLIAQDELTKCSMHRILENVIENYPHHEGIIIHQQVPHDFTFLGNSILMMKVLFNLVKNAEEQIIANQTGEITIYTKETKEHNLLVVKDTAGGIPPDVVDDIFKDFFTTKKHGTGIGLAFCKKMMNNFGGDLTCHSIFNESVEFTLSFPKITQ